MGWWALAAAGASMATQVIGANSSRMLGRKAADLQMLETREAVRRLQLSAGQAISTARARGAASGIEADSSVLTTYLHAMQSELERQVDWTMKAGAASARLARKGVNARFMGDVSQALYGFGAANNWWQGGGGSSAPSGGGTSGGAK
jgi:hypothetical protein